MIASIREEIEKELGFKLLDRTWEHLEDKGYGEKVLQGEKDPSQVADEVIDLYDALGVSIPEYASPEGRRPPLMRGTSRRPRNEEDHSRARRVDAISVLLSHDAREWGGLVKDFREEAMGNKLLSLEEVEEWVQHQAEKDGTPTKWLRVPLPEGHGVRYDRGHVIPERPFSVSEDYPAHGASVEYLAYASPSDRWTRRVPVATTGVLGRLWVLSRLFAERYGWQECQATLFILTDITPLVIDLSVWVSFKSPFTSLSRITLTIDPSLSPREVGEAYSKARQEVVGSRFRDLGEKHTQLALFAAERPEGETWKQQMKAWNEAYPQEKYMAETNFARDCSQAQRRLLTPTFQVLIPSAGRKEADNDKTR